MKTLREIGEFVGIPQGAADRFTTHEPIGLELAGRLVTLLDSNERTSMRAMTEALERLPPVTLEARLVSASSGEEPLDLVVHLEPNNAAIISTVVNATESGKVFPVVDFFLKAPSIQSGDITKGHQLGPGAFLITVERTGVGGQGFVKLNKSFQVAVSKRPGPPPPPPPKGPDPVKPSITVTSGGDGTFKVSGKDFAPNSLVTVLAADPDHPLAQNPLAFTISADAKGAFQDLPTGKICQVPGGKVTFSGQDGRIDPANHQALVSNFFTTTCPFPK